jgi:sulfide dehydrogenase cytochrome subunit
MNTTSTRLIPALCAGLLSMTTTSADGVRPASMLANTCAGCHGTNGASAGDLMPTIGGLDKGYLETTLTEFRDETRDSTIMSRIAKGYSDNELKAIASYFADRAWVSAPTDTDPGLVAKGKALHEEHCKTCHEQGGRAQEDETPRIAGQWAEYTQLALEQCRAKGRRCAPKKMGSRVSKLSDEDLEALTQYYASQK